ncbi:hypothetical protein BGW36DRAFT_433799 [Talaromyces proteolyticus]|uniref:Uncharacterized protein n=1 Tax=Talaromyces proteolyticus TaxID=1131652 RepID=A0AAD4KIC1_9EURO|nr:uncharacterized protein BGW36DRAFT_433799 [Talaromyces proteolyticus]KAH8689036.1 hypothetical protein BGW36DRAFT_433799 [Talaromyces proteolyticus]
MGLGHNSQVTKTSRSGLCQQASRMPLWEGASWPYSVAIASAIASQTHREGGRAALKKARACRPQCAWPHAYDNASGLAPAAARHWRMEPASFAGPACPACSLLPLGSLGAGFDLETGVFHVIINMNPNHSLTIDPYHLSLSLIIIRLCHCHRAELPVTTELATEDSLQTGYPIAASPIDTSMTLCRYDTVPSRRSLGS